MHFPQSIVESFLQYRLWHWTPSPQALPSVSLPGFKVTDLHRIAERKVVVTEMLENLRYKLQIIASHRRTHRFRKLWTSQVRRDSQVAASGNPRA